MSPEKSRTASTVVIQPLPKSDPLNISARRRRSSFRIRSITPYMCLLPTALLILGILLIPVMKTFLSAFSQFNEIGMPIGWSGSENFRYMFADPVFPQIVRQTIIWTVAITVIATPISVATAFILNHPFRGRLLARIIVFAPWAISFVYVAIVWKFIFDPFFGHFNAVLGWFHLDTVSTPWLGQPASAFAAVIWVGILLTIPFTTIVTLAALQSVPEDVIDAARMDGASGWRLARDVTLPLIQPVLMVATLVNIIYIFNSFPIIWVMTGGGPINSTDTIVTYLYKVTFSNNQYGEGAALSVLSFAILMTSSLIYVRLAAKEQF